MTGECKHIAVLVCNYRISQLLFAKCCINNNSIVPLMMLSVLFKKSLFFLKVSNEACITEVKWLKAHFCKSHQRFSGLYSTSYVLFFRTWRDFEFGIILASLSTKYKQPLKEMVCKRSSSDLPLHKLSWFFIASAGK